MTHLVTVSVQDLIEGQYTCNTGCPLALALARMFPEATEIYVCVSSFQFKHPKLGFIRRSFDACKLKSYHHIDEIEDLLLIFSVDSCEPEEISFEFKTI